MQKRLTMKPERNLLNSLRIENSQVDDLELIFRLFDAAIAYQEKNGYELWPRFNESLILEEISGKRHWKVLEGATIVGVFSVMYNDPVIWLERDADPSVYLHRIAVNPGFKGRGLMLPIREWARQHALQQGKTFVRMDTWGHNENLRAYYERCGFDYLGKQQLPETDQGPAHYGGSFLSLFQLKVE